MGSSPVFSVLICVHNREELLLRALKSVLAQTEKDYEVVVVDDGSDDNSFQVASHFLDRNKVQFKLEKLPRNSGIPAARNICLQIAEGTIAAFLDSDDLWHPKYLSILRFAFCHRSSPAFVFTDYVSEGPRFIGPVRQLPELRSDFDPIVSMVSEPFIHTMSCFSAPLDSIRRVSGFNESLPRFSDLDLYLKLLVSPGLKKEKEAAPFLHILQFAILKSIHLHARELASYKSDWETGKKKFLDLVFTYPFLNHRVSIRPCCEEKLDRAQERFFANFADN
jgi:glycosyltransferase involved in cell wall biosynthesis